MHAQRYRKRPVEITAVRWWSNGDHPDDYIHDFEDPVTHTMVTAAQRREQRWEGEVVRYYRRPDAPGDQQCEHCGLVMNRHGWIDTPDGGHTVCPGDYVITGASGERDVCKPNVFAETYDRVRDDEGEPATAVVDSTEEVAILSAIVRDGFCAALVPLLGYTMAQTMTASFPPSFWRDAALGAARYTAERMLPPTADERLAGEPARPLACGGSGDVVVTDGEGRPIVCGGGGGNGLPIQVTGIGGAAPTDPVTPTEP
ncbi:hypothetical protein IU459_11950 [Nocardia amamiensis]|uniref:Uncharacterized protein n=1 Tax=Nocardia amamiensis TaxID=404578 RepID=A0ABS0CNS2_9NOCA|nr:hypothetical protein [Nocardia amamiensis]MBF6298254.1 hypothetical protein [Nocardia amamiensis]